VGIFLGRETRSLPTFPEPPIPPFPGAPAADGRSPNLAGRPDLAFQVPTVWACINLIASAVSSLTLNTFQRSQDPTSVPKRIVDPPLVTAPDQGMSQSAWLHMLVVSLLTRGNGIGICRAGVQLRTEGIHLLNPDMVRVALDPASGAIVYTNAMTQRVIPSESVFHMRGLTLPGQIVGLSPISYAAATIGLDLNSRAFANGFFDGGGIPKAVLESSQAVNQEQARTIKTRVMETMRGRDPLVLGLGLKYHQIQVNPEESQFLATQQANVAQICRYFGVPAAMIDGPAGGGMQYSNTEQRGIDFLTYRLAYWLKSIEDAISAVLPDGQYVKFDTTALMRLDAETQARVDVQRLAGKIVVPSEIRARDGLDPMTPEQKIEADMVPLIVTPGGGAKATPALKELPGAVADVPDSENPTGA
jgi:HK97 family phage portal protein